MPTLNIEGRRVKVDDSFLALSPDQQNATVEEIARSLGLMKQPTEQQAQPQADKYRQAAIEERDQLKAKGINTGASLTRRAVQGATFGFGDEAVALLSTPLEMAKRGTLNPFEGYNYAKARENLILEDARDNTGLVGTGAEMVGGLMGAGQLAKAGMSFIAGIAPSASMATRAAAGAADGAIIGAITGAGEGEGAGGRAWEAAKAGTIGSTVGGAFPVAAKGASSAYEALKNMLSERMIAAKAGTTPEIMRMLGSAFEADGTMGARGSANMSRAGAAAMLADAGPNAKAILDTAIQRGGPGAVKAREAVTARTSRSAKDITEALDEALGLPEGATSARSSIRQASSAARKQAYDVAYDAPINYADPRAMVIEDLVKNRVPASAIKDANALMRLEGNSSKQILAKISDDGAVTFEKLPDVRQLDYIKRALDHAAQSGEGAGTLGGQTPLGRAYKNLSGELRDTLGDLVPEYANALRTAADPIQRSKAIDVGYKLLLPSTTRDAAAEAIRGMTMTERVALAQGVRSKIDDAVAQVTRTVQDGDITAREAVKALRDISSRASREKVGLAIGKDKAKELFDKIDRAAMSFDLRAALTENSKTYARLATEGRINQITQPGPVGKAMQGEPVKAGKTIVQMLTGKTPEKITARQDQIYSELADVLTRPRQDAMPIFTGLRKMDIARTKNKISADELRALLTRAQPALAYPSIGQLGTLSRDR